MNRVEIRKILGEVDPVIAEQVMSLAIEVDNEMLSYKTRYRRALNELNELKAKTNGVSDDEQLIQYTIYTLSRHDEVRIYFNKNKHKFSVRAIRFEDEYGLEMVGHYTRPYDYQGIKDDMRESMKEARVMKVNSFLRGRV